MQCFICVTYMIILCSTSPAKTREIATTHEKRSLFRDVIESLRIRSQLPEDIDQNDENNLSHNYERYGYENEPSRLPSDSEYIPRRNDRIEMPSLKYRFPRNAKYNHHNFLPYMQNAEFIDQSKKGLLLYIDTNVPKQPKKYKFMPQTPEAVKKVPPKDKVTINEFITEPIPDTNTTISEQTMQHETKEFVSSTPKPTSQENFVTKKKYKKSKWSKSDKSIIQFKNLIELDKKEQITSKDVITKPSSGQEINWISLNENDTKVEENFIQSKKALLKSNTSQGNNKLHNLFQILFAI